jgi:hypothetical protein
MTNTSQHTSILDTLIFALIPAVILFVIVERLEKA